MKISHFSKALVILAFSKEYQLNASYVRLNERL